MLIPKFTAWASLRSYESYSYVNSHNIYDYDNSVKIELGRKPREELEFGDLCFLENCITESCKIRCGFGRGPIFCEGTKQVCDKYCITNEEPYSWYWGGKYIDECNLFE